MQKYLIVMHGISGVPMFSVSNMCNVGSKCDDITEQISSNESLFSAFLSGIFGISEEFGGKLEHITISNMDIFAYRLKEIITLIITDPIENVTEINKHKARSRVIAELFYKTYNFYFSTNKYYNTKHFSQFQKILEEANLVDENAEFKKNCENCIFDKACPYRVLTGDPKLSIKDRISRIPRHNVMNKMRKIFKSMREYVPIDKEDQNVPHPHINSIMIFKKINGLVESVGFGCDNDPFGTLTTFEKEFITNELNYFSGKIDDKMVKIVQSAIHPHIAYGILNSDKYAILLQYKFLISDNLEAIIRDILENVEELLELYNDDAIQLQILQGDHVIAHCDICVDEREKNCFAKQVLIDMRNKLN